MQNIDYEDTLLLIYDICDKYCKYEGIQEDKFLDYIKKTNIKMDVLDFYYNLLVELTKKAKDDIQTCELTQTYLSGSIIPPPKNQDLVITQEYINDLREYSKHLQSIDTLSVKTKNYLSHNLEISALIGFHFQLKWAIEIIKKIRGNNSFFLFLMSNLNED